MSEKFSTATSNRTVFTVSQLNRVAGDLLADFPRVYVEGEISSLSQPTSGHWYFTLKDRQARVRVAMFRNRNRLVRVKPENGSKVIISGKIGIYQTNGEYQLIAEQLEESGEGALHRALEQLQRRLAAEGLFAESAKQELPALPRHLGIITSPTGAALRDVLSVLARRFPALPCTLLPVQVQGQQSASQLVAAIEQANRYRHKPFDLLLLTRGGGSLEDLWPFNEEQVARAIFASRIPIVSAVGHEIDFTTADLAADRRAATPSAAAELISPSADYWLTLLAERQTRFQQIMQRELQTKRQSLALTQRRLKHPRQRLQDHYQTVDRLQIRLARQMEQRMKLYGERLNFLPRLHLNLQRQLQTAKQRIGGLDEQAFRAARLLLQDRRAAAQRVARALHAVSPLAVLERGYSVTSLGGREVRASSELKVGDQVRIRFAEGSAQADINALDPEDDG